MSLCVGCGAEMQKIDRATLKIAVAELKKERGVF
jgi:hypothetical protein